MAMAAGLQKLEWPWTDATQGLMPTDTTALLLNMGHDQG